MILRRILPAFLLALTLISFGININTYALHSTDEHAIHQDTSSKMVSTHTVSCASACSQQQLSGSSDVAVKKQKQKEEKQSQTESHKEDSRKSSPPFNEGALILQEFVDRHECQFTCAYLL